MRLTTGFWQTYKEIPADAEISSHQLMIRSGMIHKSGAGLYNYLPMGFRVIRKIENIIREEMNKAGAFEISMTVVTPGELWKESGRWDKMGELMLTFKDKGNRDLCISPTNEESITDIFRKTVKSYKQLPLNLYQINTKFRDEIRPRFGLMRGREFTMKDAYTFDISKEGMDVSYEKMYEAYCAIFERMNFEYSPVEADAGDMGGTDSKTHEFQVIANSGEDTIIYCAKTGYAANSEKAETIRASLDFDKSKKEIVEVSTPNLATIEEVCSFLKIPKHHSLKSLVYTAKKDDLEEVVLIQLLGDDDLNEVKLKNYLGCDEVRPTDDKTLNQLMLPKGFIGPVGLKTPLKVIFDKAVDVDANYVVGALKNDFHLEGCIPRRNIKEFDCVDLRLSKKGDLTLDGKGIVDIKKGIEVGHIFQLGDKYTKALDVKVLDENGKQAYPLMGCYGIGVTRIAAAAIEQGFDDKGIIWPKEIAPYHVYFALIGKSQEIKDQAELIYQNLNKSGIETIFDDRKAGAGFKFKDADLLGLPLRVVLGEREFNESGNLEIIERKSGEKHFCKPEELITLTQELLKKL